MLIYEAFNLPCDTFRVALGMRTRMPSRSLHMATWQPSRDVSLKPKARSSMSFSSSDGSSMRAYSLASSTTTWQVEHAKDPSHAPSKSMSFACATSSRFWPSSAPTVTTSSSGVTKTTLRALGASRGTLLVWLMAADACRWRGCG